MHDYHYILINILSFINIKTYKFESINNYNNIIRKWIINNNPNSNTSNTNNTNNNSNFNNNN